MRLKQCSRIWGVVVLLAFSVASWAQSSDKTADKIPDQAACPPQASVPSTEQLQAAVAKAKDRGLLWRIAKDGRTSYLFGTIHVGKFEWAAHGRNVLGAFKAADTVALEIDPTDSALSSQFAAAPGAASLVLPESLRNRLDQQIRLACISKEALAAYHPVMQTLTLSFLDARWAGYDPAYAMEVLLVGFARVSKKPVISLETPELQMQALLPEGEKDTLDLIARSLEALESGKNRRSFERMAAAWESGNLEELASYEQWCDCVTDDVERALYKRINDGRNSNLADRIASVHAKGKSVFAAVGALHMTGEKALPKLMAERGFVVERVNFQ